MRKTVSWRGRIGLMTVGVLMWSLPVLAAEYPTQPVKLLVPYSAGGASDTMARYFAQRLSDIWGEQVVVENQPGSSGALAYNSLSGADPDGYTLGYATTSLAMNPLLIENLPYDTANDFQPVSKLLEVQNVLVVPPSLGVESVDELIELAKSRPGELNYVSLGAGSTPHLSMELFKHAAGVDVTAVPYKATTQGYADIVEGRVDLWIASLPSALPFIQDGRLRALAVAGSSRSSALPDVPTLQEAGVPAEASFWHAIFAPAGTDPEIVEAVNATVDQIIAEPETKEWFHELGVDLDPSTPEELGTLLEGEMEKWGQTLRELDLDLP